MMRIAFPSPLEASLVYVVIPGKTNEIAMIPNNEVGGAKVGDQLSRQFLK